MSAVEQIDLPALPQPGNSVTFEVASRTTAGQHYTVTVSTLLWTLTVAVDCSCPARRQCWHRTTAEQVYVARGEARRTPEGLLLATTTLVAVPDPDDDVFAGLV